jgi:hypothetical protein
MAHGNPVRHAPSRPHPCSVPVNNVGRLPPDLGRATSAPRTHRRARTTPQPPTERTPIGTSGADGAAEFERRRGRFWRTGRYERACARLYRCSTSPGIRPLAGTAIPCSVAQARITLGSRLDVLVERDDVVRIDPRRRLDCRSPATGRAAFQYLSSALDSEARFFFDRSISRQSPFHPSRTVSAPSDPSRSSTNTSTVTFAIACLSMPGSTISEGTAAVSWPTATVSCRSRCTATDPVERWPGTIEPSGTG